MDDVYVYIRGIPVTRRELEQFEAYIGGKLVVPDTVEKAAIVAACDKALARYRQKVRDSKRTVVVDTNLDPFSRYYGVNVVPPQLGGFSVQMVPSKSKPAGLVAWFKVPKIFSVPNFKDNGR
jgi:hypothetical protein